MSETEEDFEALFDEVSAHRNVISIEAAPETHKGEGELSKVVAISQPILGEHNKQMFSQLGTIVRSLHNSLRELGVDKVISETAKEVSNAKDRLEYIATLTENSANKVLNTLDQSMPEQEILGEYARVMQTRWDALFDGNLSVEEFKLLANDSRNFSAMVIQKTDAEKACLLDIMMAQDFQDISGQVIKKVISITTRVETELAQLLLDHAPEEIRSQHKAVDLMEGPSMPAVAMKQDDVDGLLAELGF